MSISVRIGGVLVPITEVITKMGGVLISKSPLQAKISGILVDFISYGYSTTAIMNLSPTGFDSSMLASTINGIPSNIDVIVRFASGTFLFNTPCNITRSNVSLIGSVQSVLKCNGNYGGNGILQFTGVSGTELENLVVEGVTLDGDYLTSGHTSYCICCLRVGKNFINTGAVYDATKVGVTYVNKIGIKIKDCIIKNSSGLGVSFSIVNNSLITGNTMYNINSFGTFLNNSFNNLITNNEVQNISLTGVYISTSNNNSIIGNTLQNNGGSGVESSGSSNNSIIGNTVQNNNGKGICITSSSNNSITGNTVQSNNEIGVWAGYSSDYNVINGNTIQYNGQVGLTIMTSSNNTITGNTITANAYNAIMFDSSACVNNIFQGNGLSGNGNSSIYNAGVGTKNNFNIV